MRALLVIAVVLLASVFANTLLDVGDQLSPELLKSVRMIQLAENEEPIAVTLAELLEMKINGASFFDVTDRQYRPFGKQAVPLGPALPNQPQQKAIVNPLLKQLSTDNLRSNVEILSAYRTRFYSTTSGTAAAHWIHDTLLAYSSQRNDVTVSFFHSNTTAPQPSVIARLEGTLSTDVVIIGSHEDSVHLGAAGVSPGVDDDGSGTVCVLEIFRVLMENNYKPNRTIEFHFYAAEEVGLLGSQAVATQYAADNTVVVGMMQLDMTFYIGKNGENLVGIVTDFVDADLTAFSRMLVDSYLDIGWINTVCGYGCSDHASWTKEGYRSTFPFESQFVQHNPYIHTAKDTLAYADLDHGLEFAKLGLGFVVELAATVYRT